MSNFEEKCSFDENYFDARSSSNLTSDNKKPPIGYRWVIALLGFSSYFIQFFIRNGLSVALVAMVNSTGTETHENYTSNACPAALNKTSDESDSSEETGEFDWSPSDQSIILGAYFWGYLISKLFGSRIAEVAGQRSIVALGMFLPGVLSLLSPPAASLHPYALAATRLLIGVSYGPLPAALQTLISIWAPRDEVSSMVNTMFAGSALGGMVAFISAGWLETTFGWKTIFWIGSLLSFLFLPPWVILVRNSPQEHPWLSAYEIRLLEQNNEVTTKKTVPWMKILKSPYVNICIWSHFARSWLDFILASVGPSFFSYKIGLSINSASLTCAANYLTSTVVMIIFGRISDAIGKTNLVKAKNIRKLFHTIGAGGSGLLLIGLGIADCNAAAAVTIWVLIGVTMVGTNSSYFISLIDLAPNYAGTLIGIISVGNLGAAFAPLVTSSLLNTENGWNKSFYLAAGLCLPSWILYTAFITDETQAWNDEAENASRGKVASIKHKT